MSNIRKIKDFILRVFFHRRLSFMQRLHNHIMNKAGNKKMVYILIPLLFIVIFAVNALYSPFSNKSALYYRQMSEYYVEPFQIIKGLEDTILFDIRPYERYKSAHIIDARHLNVEVDPDSGRITNRDEILRSANQVRNRKDLVLIYGENEYSPLPAEVAALLSENGVKVKLLSVGWNEFRHFSTFWLPESINARVDITDFIQGEEVVSTN